MNDKLRIPDSLFVKLLGMRFPFNVPSFFDVELGENQRVMWSAGMSERRTESGFLTQIQAVFVELSAFTSLLLAVPFEIGDCANVAPFLKPRAIGLPN